MSAEWWEIEGVTAPRKPALVAPAKWVRWPSIVDPGDGRLRCGQCCGLAEANGLGFDAVSVLVVDGTVEPGVPLERRSDVSVECPDCGREWSLRPGQQWYREAFRILFDQGGL